MDNSLMALDILTPLDFDLSLFEDIHCRPAWHKKWRLLRCVLLKIKPNQTKKMVRSSSNVTNNLS